MESTILNSMYAHTSLSVMAYPGARVVILCCFFVHFAFNADLVIVQGASSLLTGLMHLVQGITLLFYPVLGLVADLKCNHQYLPLDSVCHFLRHKLT